MYTIEGEPLKEFRTCSLGSDVPLRYPKAVSKIQCIERKKKKDKTLQISLFFYSDREKMQSTYMLFTLFILRRSLVRIKTCFLLLIKRV